jgi:transcriptional regulator with XRE-family HTH domain
MSASTKYGIGSRVRTARERLGWSRETLAFHSGISWSAITQVESGRRTNLRPATLEALARALGVTIDYLVAGRRPVPMMLNHRALTYANDDEFAASAVPFVEEALERSEPALVVTGKANRKLLERRLGSGAGAVEFADQTKWYRTPTAALKSYTDFLDAKLDAGAAWVRIIGEPVWASRSKEQIQLWTRYESLINLAFSGAPVTIMCPYDTRALDPDIVRQAHVTHPHTVESGHITASAEYVEPGDFLLDE